MVFWLASVAFAGNLYINGTLVDSRSISGVMLEQVDLKIDASGNIYVDAPGYKIEVVDPGSGAVSTPPAPALNPPPRPVPRAAGGGPTANGVARARWWLVTEDNGSVGHTIEIYVGGALRQTLQSGGPQRILDIGPWLSLGDNQLEMKSTSSNASGGTFYLYVGTGSDESGTVVMDDPQVQFGLGANRAGPYERSYSLAVDQ